MLCVNSKDIDQDAFAFDLKTLVVLLQSLVELSVCDESAPFTFQSQSSQEQKEEGKKKKKSGGKTVSSVYLVSLMELMVRGQIFLD